MDTDFGHDFDLSGVCCGVCLSGVHETGVEDQGSSRRVFGEWKSGICDVPRGVHAV